MPITNLIVQSQVPSFLILFRKIERFRGGIVSACRDSGINENAYYRMKSSNFLTEANARKIMAAYKRLNRELQGTEHLYQQHQKVAA